MQLDLFIDLASRSLVQSSVSAAPALLPSLSQGDTVNLRVYLLQRNASYPFAAPFNILNNAGLSLKVALGDKAGTGTGNIIAAQFVWTASGDNTYLFASLALNTAELNAALGAAASMTKWLEVELTESALPTTILQTQVLINADVIKNGAVAPIAGLTPISAEEARNLFAKRFGAPGETLTLVSPNGQWARTLGVDNLGNKTDAIEAIV